MIKKKRGVPIKILKLEARGPVAKDCVAPSGQRE